MSKRKTVDPAILDSISQNIFCILPLLRKRLLHIDVIQNEHGIPFSHVQVLCMLEQTGSMSVSEISSRLGIAKPNITPLVDRLISSQYVDRVRDAQDRRVVNIIILEKGQQKLEAIQKTVGEQIWDWAQNISATDFRELSICLQSISRILSQA